jgi:glycosyltransferase involved in cell wall biosynthesis
MNPRWQGVPFLSDLSSGIFAAESPAAYAHFCNLLARLNPDLIQLEHPFMWPLVKRMRHEGRLDGIQIIYSSHNWEGPLKESILLRAGVPSSKAAAVRAEIEAMEAELVSAAAVVIAVSPADAEIYRGLTTEPKVFVAPNGTSRPPAEIVGQGHKATVVRKNVDGKFMFFVGSAYPPNIEGFQRLVAEGGFYFLPPEKAVVVCGGASEGIFNTGEYQRFILGNSERVQFLSNLDDADLWAFKDAAHLFLLPIEFGGGTNLKSAEAIASGKWVIATSNALRGRDEFMDAPGIIVANTQAAFREAMIKVMASPPLKLTAKERMAREQVYWDQVMINSGVREVLTALPRRAAGSRAA